MLLVMGVIGAAVAYVQLAAAARVAQELGARLRKRLFVHIEHLSLAWHGRQRVGDLVQRISGNVTDIEKLVADGLVDLLSGILTLVGFLVVMLLLNWQFTLLSMVMLPPLAVVIVGYTRWIKRASRQTAKALGEVAEVANEGVGAITEVKAFTLERWLARTFFDRVERKRRFGWRAGRRQAEFDPLVLTLVTFSNVAIITVGAWIAFGHGHPLLSLVPHHPGRNADGRHPDGISLVLAPAVLAAAHLSEADAAGVDRVQRGRADPGGPR